MFDQSQTWYRSNLRKAMFSSARNNAKARGIPFTLTLEDIPAIPTHCPILGLPLHVGAAGRTDNSPSLDRIDNAKGYIPGNVVLVSWRANRLKGSATATELMQLANFYKELLNV